MFDRGPSSPISLHAVAAAPPGAGGCPGADQHRRVPRHEKKIGRYMMTPDRADHRSYAAVAARHRRRLVAIYAHLHQRRSMFLQSGHRAPIRRAAARSRASRPARAPMLTALDQVEGRGLEQHARWRHWSSTSRARCSASRSRAPRTASTAPNGAPTLANRLVPIGAAS